MNIFQKYKEAILYLVFGVLSTLVNIGAYAFATRILGFNYYTSNIKLENRLKNTEGLSINRLSFMR